MMLKDSGRVENYRAGSKHLPGEAGVMQRSLCHLPPNYPHPCNVGVGIGPLFSSSPVSPKVLHICAVY